MFSDFSTLYQTELKDECSSTRCWKKKVVEMMYLFDSIKEFGFFLSVVSGVFIFLITSFSYNPRNPERHLKSWSIFVVVKAALYMCLLCWTTSRWHPVLLWGRGMTGPRRIALLNNLLQNLHLTLRKCIFNFFHFLALLAYSSMSFMVQGYQHTWYPLSSLQKHLQINLTIKLVTITNSSECCH